MKIICDESDYKKCTINDFTGLILVVKPECLDTYSRSARWQLYKVVEQIEEAKDEVILKGYHLGDEDVYMRPLSDFLGVATESALKDYDKYFGSEATGEMKAF
jgi:hypothetical protein